MKPWLEKGAVTLYHGDALETLRTLPDESVQMVASSPPFWGLRDYGTGSWLPASNTPEVIALTDACDHLGEPFRTKAKINQNCGTGNDVKNAAGRQPMRSVCTKCGAIRVDNQIGLEETPDQWVTRLVDVYRECRRVLRDDGVMFIEIGDSYATGTGAPSSSSTLRGNGHVGGGPQIHALEPTSTRHPTKPKDLVGQPWLLAFALRADGWYLRSEIIWARPNPMPESVTDRPTKAHSTVFLLSKRPRYYYDADAIREPGTSLTGNRREFRGGGDYAHGNAFNNNAKKPNRTPGNDGETTSANARSVWSIPTEPTPFAHFATWPQALIERMIRCGTSEKGACSSCGAPWRRVVEREVTNPGNRSNNGQYDGHEKLRRGFEARREVSTTTSGWMQSCRCHDYSAPAPVVPCTILDPFMGSGTTALVARRLGRHAIGIELNEEYLGIARNRLSIPDEDGVVAKSRFALEGQRGFDLDV